MMGMYQSHDSTYKQPTPTSSRSMKFCSALLSTLLAMKHVSFTDILDFGFGFFFFSVHVFTSSISTSSWSPQITVTFNCYLSILDLNRWPRDERNHSWSHYPSPESTSLWRMWFIKWTALLLTVFFQCLTTHMKLQYFSHSHCMYVRYLHISSYFAS